MQAKKQQNDSHRSLLPADMLLSGAAAGLVFPRQTNWQRHTFKDTWDRRGRIIGALALSRQEWQRKKALRLAECCNRTTIFPSPATRTDRFWASTCHDRMCPCCSRVRSAKVTKWIAWLIKVKGANCFATLTVPNSDIPLKEQLDKFDSAYRKLRHTKRYRELCEGEIRRVETTVNEETGLFNLHYHLVMKSKYFPQAEFQKMWEKASGEKMAIVFVEFVDNIGAARELVKYLGLPKDISHWTAEQIREHDAAFRGRPEYQPSGSFWGLKAEFDGEPSPRPIEEAPIDWSLLIRRTRDGFPTALEYLIAFCLDRPTQAGFVYRQIPDMVPELAPIERNHPVLTIARGDRPPRPNDVARGLTDEQLADRKWEAYACYMADCDGGVFGSTGFLAGAGVGPDPISTNRRFVRPAFPTCPTDARPAPICFD